ncbi:ABC transporter substrate-binding protein [Horticoccus sp. 23ND18S-11]|uniref:ABC transporter substrate-binding protein n=1 Tax=Horticoccus sp. 23ND18S-11 TaxID=3391832 RepID=UPI0039C94354
MSNVLRVACVLMGLGFLRLPAAESIKVGFFMSITGRDASFGEASLRGARLAVETLNANGGVLGRPLELIVEDNRSQAGESATAAKKLITRDRVVALIGECSSGRTLEAAPVAQAAGVPLITPASTSPKVTQVGDAIFRVCFIDPFQGDVLAAFARRRLGLKRAALLVDSSSPYSVGLAEYFSRTFTALGGEIVVAQKYTGADTDFRAQLTAIRAAQPDAIFLPGYYVAAGLVAQQARQLGLTATLLGGDGFEAPQLLEIGGAALEGAYYATHFAVENTDAASQRFVDAFRARHGALPNGLSALSYDAVGLVVDAIARAGTTEKGALRQALAATKDFPGVTGRTTLNAQRDADKDAAIIAVKGGRLAFVETVRP